MMIAAISWRNVWRNKLRSIVIIMAITAGLTGGIFTVAMYNGMTEQQLRTAVDTQTANLQIHAPVFQKNKDIRLYLKHPDATMRAVDTDPAIRSLAPRLVATGMADSTTANAGVQLNGI